MADLVRALRRQVLLGVCVYLAAMLASRAIGPLDWPALPRLLFAGAAGAAYALWHLSRFNPDQMFVLRRALRFA